MADDKKKIKRGRVEKSVPDDNTSESKKAIPAEAVREYGDEGAEPIRPITNDTKKHGKHKKTFSEKKFKRSFFLSDLINTSLSRQNLEKRPGYIRLFKKWYIPLFWVIVIGAIAFVGVLSTVYSNTMELREETILISNLPSDLEGFKVLMISDMNGESFGENQAMITNALKSVSYDAVVLLGDMVGKSGNYEPFLELIDELGASKVYFIAGDCDPDPVLAEPRDVVGTLDQMVLADWILAAQEMGATYVDSPVLLTKKSGSVWFYPATMLNVNATDYVETIADQVEQETEGMLSGLTGDYTALPVTSYRQKCAEELYEAIDTIKSGDLCICLAHEPPSDKMILTSGYHPYETGKYLKELSVVMAGHYCGGVWRLPLIGAIYVQSSVLDRNGWFPDDELVNGVYSVDATVKVCVTRGLSTNGDVWFPFRMWNQPQLMLITFKAASSTNLLG